MAYTHALLLLLSMVAVSATAMGVAPTSMDRKLMQASAAAGQCGPPNAVYVGDDNNSCQQCAQRPNTVAWCCRSDDTASPTECKRAGANCCEGPEYRYLKRERDDGGIETDDGELDDVWCVPNTCQDNFQPPQANAAVGSQTNAGATQANAAPAPQANAARGLIALTVNMLALALAICMLF